MATSKDLKKLNLEEAALESEARIRELEALKASASLVNNRKEILALEKAISKEKRYQESVVNQLAKLDDQLVDSAESYSEKLQQQIRKLNLKKKLGKDLLAEEEQLLDLATEYQEKLKKNPEHVKELIK